MTTVWILVANSSRARIFSANSSAKPILEIRDFTHPASRLHQTDLTENKQGRSFDSAGEGRHALENESTPKDHEIDKFSAELAAHLNTAQNNGDFSRLVLISSPSFLGRLRPRLNKNTTDLVIDSIDKDLTLDTPAEIKKYLPKEVWSRI